MKTESTASIYRMGGRRKRQKRLTASSAPAKRVYRHVGTNEKPDDVYNDVGSVKTHFSGHLPGSSFSLARAFSRDQGSCSRIVRWNRRGSTSHLFDPNPRQDHDSFFKLPNALGRQDAHS